MTVLVQKYGLFKGNGVVVKHYLACGAAAVVAGKAPRYGAGLKVHSRGVAVGIIRVLYRLAAGHCPGGQQAVTAVVYI